MKQAFDRMLTISSLMLAAALIVPRYSFGEGQVRLISSGGSSISFEVLVPTPSLLAGDEGSTRVLLEGYGSFSPPGAAEAPGKTFHVAIPPGGDARVVWTVLEDEFLGPLKLPQVAGERMFRGEDGIPYSRKYYPPDPWEGSIKTRVVSAGKPAFMGRQRILPVRVNPLIENRGELRLVRKISITVYIENSRAAGLENRFRADPVSGAWKKIYQDILVNPDDVSAFRKPLQRREFIRADMEAGKKLKIRVPETGAYSIRADSLIASGLSPDLSNTGFALKKYYYDPGEPELIRRKDIPLRVIKGANSSPDIFENDDLLVFYALGIKDDAEAGDLDAAFTNDNIIWLEENEAGAIMPEGPPPPAATGNPAVSFAARYKGRKDAYYQRRIKAGTRDFCYLLGPVSDQAVLPFTIYNPDAASNFSLSLRMTSVNENSGQNLTFKIRNSTGEHTLGTRPLSPMDHDEFSFTGISGSWLAGGVNEIVISGGITWGYLVNDFVVDYGGIYVAHDDKLEFTTTLSIVPAKIAITGFTSGRGCALDVTDQENPIFFTLPPDSFHVQGSNYTLSWAVPQMSENHYIVLGDYRGGHIYNAWISVDNPSSLRTRGGPYNSLVIAHADFLPPHTGDLVEYLSWREAQGYRILTADVQDVYDEFNGGLKSCAAIKRFIQYGVDHWGVEYVILVGDGNEDRKRIFIGDPPDKYGTPPDYIPAYIYSEAVIGADIPDEVIASDKYYSLLDEAVPSARGSESAYPGTEGEGPPGERDWMPQAGYPDVFLGRFPVGRELELKALLVKLRRYEVPDISDTWRRRVILFADDAWSGLFNSYVYKPIELRFETSMDAVGKSIEETLPGGFEIQRLFLSRWTDTAHNQPGQSGSVIYHDSNDSTRTYFTPYLLKKLNSGALFFSFQGHAARGNFTTEAAFSMFDQYKDLDSLRTDRNFVFVGLGCHISEFALVGEYNRAAFEGPNGDCISEQLLLKSRAGAVGTYASTGYEYLDENAVYCQNLFDSFFREPAVDSIPPLNQATGAHWVLGEMITRGEIDQIASTGYGYAQVFRHVLFGDPMLKIDPGPPLIKLEADWGEGWTDLSSDYLHSGSRDNSCRMRFTASDVVALGAITLQVGGQDRTGDLNIIRLGDEDLTYARGYQAQFDYTLSLEDGSILFRVFKPEGDVCGSRELIIDTELRLFFNGHLEIIPGVESPPEGDFRLEADFPLYLTQAPELWLDGMVMGGVAFSPDPQDSSRWAAEFNQKLSAGGHTLTVLVGNYTKDFRFTVTGDDLVMDTFNFPNPFSGGTNICYTLNLDGDAGEIDIYNVSGRLIRSFDIPRNQLVAATNIRVPNRIFWDGRDLAGDRVANGTYIYVIRIWKDGSEVTLRNKLVKLE
ncbi:MAG: hypothetical protein JXB45_00380 [Candidatus Krumholzibacteriota bacterium]|nr:hypothetical protein [Candidatus Krumholzibacteriota bacterium]